MEENKFAGRAGAKLDFALGHFGIDVKGKTACDLGAAVGGFTDCLLKRGAAKAYAVDTAYGALDWKLRNDPRVVVMERANAMHVELPERADIVTIDVGWTRQEKVVPNALRLLADGGRIITLVKPHYEAEKSELKGGTVLDGLAEKIVARVRERIEALGAKVEGEVESPLLGGKGGNREFFLLLSKKGGSG